MVACGNGERAPKNPHSPKVSTSGQNPEPKGATLHLSLPTVTNGTDMPSSGNISCYLKTSAEASCCALDWMWRTPPPSVQLLDQATFGFSASPEEDKTMPSAG